MWTIIIIVAALLTTTFLMLGQSKFGKLPRGARLERIQQSPNYHSGEFRNVTETPVMTSDEGFLKSLYNFMFKDVPGLKPQDSIPMVRTNLRDIPLDSNVAVWFGHSSYYMQINGKRLLVDPVFSNHASPFSWMIKAFKGTNLYSADDMPDIDYLLITHDHRDHLDYATITQIHPRVQRFFCGLGVGAHLEYWGVKPDKITELDWNDTTVPTNGWKIHAVTARHFSGRSFKRNQTLWVSFVLETPGLKLFLGGDGGYGPHLADIGNRFGPFDLAVLEQGQYNHKWAHIHLLPEQLFTALTELQAKQVLPVHHSKFALAEHSWTEPLERISSGAEALSSKVLTPVIGQKVRLPVPAETFGVWWR
ncbi:L-ascorbate metabolism protein UlaG (beta-lactamase superfamily) [Breznakibacter xylanolyticus]|uniref:L-ascorbate metabolism protein UlaG (Beta-lactamase superfamily) n=2 Tax=Breznakibacter xylanolyticus TaxID=990 RepID=A0A2W7MQW8_9BACT|nr:L-ascorbate metabolism protein UlaG (beta-lactamase superfamily) [Breznakibacter xylanolyticus]